MVEASGEAVPAGQGGDGGEPRYGWDAVRVAPWMAAGCAVVERRTAAALWPFLRAQAGAGGPAAVYTLAGRPLSDTPSPVSLAAAAAAAAAAGDIPARDHLLTRAQAQDAALPTYYGGAWAALGPLLLVTRRLGGCAPGS